jgi:hypothetical protein
LPIRYIGVSMHKKYMYACSDPNPIELPLNMRQLVLEN